MNQLHLMTVLVSVVENGGMQAAAHKLKMSASSVTRAVTELEDSLSVRLLVRTTRMVRLTQAGESYLEDCRRILADVQTANESVRSGIGSPKGRISVTAPALFGELYLMPMVTEYLEQFPNTNVACWFSDEVINMLEEGVDVAVRIGKLADSSFQATKVGHLRNVLCASPSYLRRHGVPGTPQDLLRHNIVLAGSLSRSVEWDFKEDNGLRTVKLSPRLVTTTSESAIAAVVAGFGITHAKQCKVGEQLNNGTLVRILEAFETDPEPINVLHREGPFMPSRVRAFLDLVITRLRADSRWR